MSLARVQFFPVSLDGYGAGEGQRLETSIEQRYVIEATASRSGVTHLRFSRKVG